jgi:hypothetical protein
MGETTERRRDTQIGFRINSGLKVELEGLARADGRSLANYLERVLEAHVQQQKDQGAPAVRLRGAKAKR